MPFSEAAQSRIDALTPHTVIGPDYRRAVDEALRFARGAARWGDCGCLYILEAEVSAGTRPRGDLARARSTPAPEFLTQGGVIHDELCSCPVRPSS
ncbi:hypothetical protein ACIRQF_31280 [Streptomyces sp. NPDC101191]|uniref:hypothetical protein n=1 Tax=Streptomyces sp. NPDC101191 TaxID=3366126 RepID=UPI00382F2D45